MSARTGTASCTAFSHDHFHAFADAYDSLYAQDYGKFRLERISHVVDKFESCGDYTKGIARIRGHGIPWHSVLQS
jgi:hypothetical protein